MLRTIITVISFPLIGFVGFQAGLWVQHSRLKRVLNSRDGSPEFAQIIEDVTRKFLEQFTEEDLNKTLRELIYK